jgi:hypothetical protein
VKLVLYGRKIWSLTTKVKIKYKGEENLKKNIWTGGRAGI